MFVFHCPHQEFREKKAKQNAHSQTDELARQVREWSKSVVPASKKKVKQLNASILPGKNIEAPVAQRFFPACGGLAKDLSNGRWCWKWSAPHRNMTSVSRSWQSRGDGGQKVALLDAVNAAWLAWQKTVG